MLRRGRRGAVPFPQGMRRAPCTGATVNTFFWGGWFLRSRNFLSFIQGPVSKNNKIKPHPSSRRPGTVTLLDHPGTRTPARSTRGGRRHPVCYSTTGAVALEQLVLHLGDERSRHPASYGRGMCTHTVHPPTCTCAQVIKRRVVNVVSLSPWPAAAAFISCCGAGLLSSKRGGCISVHEVVS